MEEFLAQLSVALSNMEFSKVDEAAQLEEFKRVSFKLMIMENNKTSEHLDKNKRKIVNHTLKEYYKLFDFNYGADTRQKLTAETAEVYKFIS